ncbi:uncharacterized protein BP01DRAFT_422520 [Aspergillus saccharolyticus JOP 1030-1]|uniref:ABM domain-containing protein n=1 Tax=Aspergillus saccharolyticus JOP 1030-1 TaxID=1450539 RepID=A0A319AIP7_9EURO|nr:hypothetical protein BP01DRAFT_422520 [Aspergillus saccharolyticus JOP 1030-1]PYH46552.1 hypothetical protein BP01DRAFT_422520 [Aspergillus saccharolyticus JOP 1030-1]
MAEQSVTELIYFHVKDTVKPEDPAHSDEGAALLQVFANTKHQSGYKGSAWGRAIEDENLIVWAIDWKDAHTGANPHTTLSPFLHEDAQEITIVFATLTSTTTTTTTDDDKAEKTPTTTTATLTQNPVTELWTPAFPTSLAPGEVNEVHASLIGLRKAVTEQLPAGQRAVSFAMGQVERPGTTTHEQSETGEAFVVVIAAGWESVEVHLKGKETEAFQEAIGKVRGHLLAPVRGLGGLKHVEFKGVE